MEQTEIVVIYETRLRSRASHIVFLVLVGIMPRSVANGAVNHIRSIDVLIGAA